jgi:hypothetical protein
MEMERMNHFNLTKNQYAVAGVIEALLLVAMFSIILSTVQLIYIPDIMEQREVEHMDEVENQLSYLKSVIDLQSSMSGDVPISSPLTLGSRELPYFVTARAFGQLDIIDSDKSYITFSPALNSGKYNISLTSIKYQAINSYYLDQYYIFEGSGLILKQYDGESMRIEPSISYTNQSNVIRIQWSLPVFESVGGKNSTSGFKGCYIRTNKSSAEIDDGIFSNDEFIHIHSEYLDAWNNSLNQLFEELVKNEYISINKRTNLNCVEIKVINHEKDIDLELTMSTLKAQIGPGIVIES